jgi:hypothetical protein
MTVCRIVQLRCSTLLLKERAPAAEHLDAWRFVGLLASRTKRAASVAADVDHELDHV